MESALSDIPTARLAALKANLTARGIPARLESGSLAVLAPTDEQVDTITCRPWPVDGDRWWFFDCEDEAIAEAGDVVGAAVAILGAMHRSGIHV